MGHFSVDVGKWDLKRAGTTVPSGGCKNFQQKIICDKSHPLRQNYFAVPPRKRPLPPKKQPELGCFFVGNYNSKWQPKRALHFGTRIDKTIILRYNNKQLYQALRRVSTGGIDMTSEEARTALRIAAKSEGPDHEEIMRIVKDALPGTERVTKTGAEALRQVGKTLVIASFVPGVDGSMWIHVLPVRARRVRRALEAKGLQVKQL